VSVNIASIPLDLLPSQPFVFPIKGINHDWARVSQLPGTTVDCMNVMAYDLAGRARGGVRPGISIAATNSFGAGGTGTTFMQCMNICNVIQGTGSLDYTLSYRDGFTFVIPRDPTSPSYAQFITVIAGGNVYSGTTLTSIAAVTGGTVRASVFVSAAVIDGRMYLTDGGALKAVDMTVTPPVFTTYAASGGTVPANPSFCCVYRKRLVVYGDGSAGGASQNFYASRVGAPNDWDYGKTDPAAAWTANASKTGQPGEPVNVLVPLGDDAMVIGCDRSIWLMNGDIQDGGRIDVLTRGIGMTQAFCFDPPGNLYFLASNGFYRISRGTFIIADLSIDKYQQYFTQPPAGGLVAKTLVYDKQLHGIWIFVTNFAVGLSVHLFYDLRTQGFFPQQFPDTMGPARSILYDPAGISSSVLLGGLSTNGTATLYKIDPTVATDNGGAISSYVWLGPVRPGTIQRGAKMIAVDFVLGDTPAGFIDANFQCSYSIQAGNNALAAMVAPDETRAGTFTTPGRQTTVRCRQRGDSFMVRISNTSAGKLWSLEEVAAQFAPGGRVRT
jgi:hypothetical protein